MRALGYDCSAWRFLACRAVDRAWPGVYFSPLAPVRLREIAFAPPAERGWAVIRVHQCGLCASDLHLLRLALSARVAPSVVLGRSGPSVLGHELVGTVESVVGPASLRPGQRVVSRSGGFRNCFNLGADPCERCVAGEYALCQRQGDPPPPHEVVRGGGFAERYVEHEANLLPVPETLSDDEATLAEPLACSLRAVLARTGKPAGRVLVIGAGIQGLGAVHWLRSVRSQDQVTCLARYGFQADLARELGARVLEAGAATADLARHLGTRRLSAYGGDDMLLEGFDAVIDSIGTPATLGRALRWVRPRGQIVVLGAHLFPGRIDYSPLWFREVTVCGTYAHGMETFEGRRIATLALTLDLLAGRARLPLRLVTHRLALDRYRDAVGLLDDKGASGVVKAVLIPDAAVASSNAHR